jgi:hypothetical protein
VDRRVMCCGQFQSKASVAFGDESRFVGSKAIDRAAASEVLPYPADSHRGLHCIVCKLTNPQCDVDIRFKQIKQAVGKKLYPKVQAWFRDKQSPAFIVWGKNDFIFPEGARIPTSKGPRVPPVDTGHFVLEDKAHEVFPYSRLPGPQGRWGLAGFRAVGAAKVIASSTGIGMAQDPWTPPSLSDFGF